ncbi:hypothetical protein KC960_03095 [Candidatus Saccharibacteria bacterium]|nr:hypothetical protein [Candidatus Saccharibacteria bacterium]
MVKTMEKLNFRILTTAVTAGLGSLGLSACGPKGPEVTPNVPAVVVGHSYDDADNWFMPICARTCILVPQHDDEHFYLDVEQCGHEEFKKNNDEGCGVIDVEVSGDTYMNFADGSTIVFDK